jgi:dTDP-4-dehydrorhamnose reductase
MKIIILGANGMLGHALFTRYSANPNFEVFGTIRNSNAALFSKAPFNKNIFSDIDLLNFKSIKDVLFKLRPALVFNCVGLTKHNTLELNPKDCIEINSLLPHIIKSFCDEIDAQFITFSTDCVFSGSRGLYSEHDFADADDIYGRTKYLGEVIDNNSITIRTSIIGHELQTRHGLLEWFLSNTKSCSGYTKAFFSGFPTAYLAKIIEEYILNRPNLSGLFHIASPAISKFELLTLINAAYKKNIHIVPDESIVINRSLNGSSFAEITGFMTPSWTEMVEFMHQSFVESNLHV